MLVILVLTAALGIVGVDNYLDRAEQEARDSVARTIFMAAQTALTHEYNQDREYYTNTNRVPLPGPYDFLPGGADGAEAKKQDHNPPALVYLVMSQSGDNSGETLYQMIAPYINDKSVLNDNILIEYNRETGMMLSAFYSEVTGKSLGYSGAEYDVRARDESALTKGLVGFYGVNSTGEVIRTNPIDTSGYEILLVDYIDPLGENYGLLTAEIVTPRTVDENYVFSLSLIPQAGTAETVTFAAPDGVVGVDFTLADLAGVDTVEAAMNSPRNINGRSIPVYYESFGNAGKIVVVLDGVRSFGETTPDIGITKNFPNIKGGVLTGTLEISDNTDTASIDSEDYGDAVHAFYGADSTASALSVKSVRHLNNIRYCHTAANFVQRANVYMHNYKGEKLNFTPISNRLDAWVDGGGQTDFGFYGDYTSTPDYAIFDLSIDLTGQTIPDAPDENDQTLYNAGLFDTVRHGAHVAGLRFASSSPVTDAVPRSLRIVHYGNEGILSDAIAIVKGVDYAGGVAAVNEGTIEECTMLGSVTADMDSRSDGAAGGIAGGNSNGTITHCATACAVSGNRYAGGIAGRSDGTISYCEAGTASWRDWDDATQLYTSGVPAYGAEETQSVYAGGTHTSNNTFRVKIEKDNGASGGIVGYMSGTGAKVTGCVNACKVEAGNEIDGEGAHSGGMAGGITGGLAVTSATDYVAIGYSYNAGAVYATGSAGGLVGEVQRGHISCCYNTGHVDRESTFNGTVKALNNKTYRYTNALGGSETFTCYLPGIPRNLKSNSPNHAGGLIGLGERDTRIDNCYSMQYAGDRYGGAFGVVSADASISNCSLLSNVLNNTSEFYYTESRRHASGASPLKIYTVENLRKAPSDGNLDSTYFADGSFLSPAGVGVFGYKFPYLKFAAGNVALPTHRTPLHPVIERFGSISFPSGELAARSEIICSFYLAPPEGLIHLFDGNDRSRYSTYIPLFDPSGYNSLTDARNAAGSADPWLPIHGFASREDAYRSGSTQNSEYEIRARLLNPDNTADARRIAQGFTHEYQIRMVYYYDRTSGVTVPTLIPNGVELLIADLYNDFYSTHEGDIVDEARLGESGLLYLTDPSGNGGACVLEMAIDPGTDRIQIDIEYADGTVQRINIPHNFFSGGYPRSFAQTINNFTDCRVGFTPGHNTVNSDTEGWRFPCYLKNGDTVGVVLWTDWPALDGHTRRYDAPDFNMLGTSFRARVTVRVFHGNSSTLKGKPYYKTFYNWRA